MFCGIFIYFFGINAPFECILHKSYYIYITIKFHQIFTFFRPFSLHSYNTYYVRVGGAAVSTSNPKGYISTEFTVGDTKVLIGDVDGVGGVDIQDASEVAKCCAHLSSAADKDDRSYLAAAYSDGNNIIDIQDASEVAKFCAHLTTTYVNTTVDIGKYGNIPTQAE